MFDYKFLQEQLNWRAAVKTFNPEAKLEREQVEQILETMRLAPSSYGLQLWRFVVVDSAELRAKMREVSYDQPQVTDASRLIVIAHRDDVTEQDVDNYIAAVAKTRGQEISDLADYRNSIWGALSRMAKEEKVAWAARQSYIALGFALQAAALMKIDAGPMEGFDTEAVTKLLGLDEKGYQAVAYIALGHRSSDDKYADLPKVRYSSEEVVGWE